MRSLKFLFLCILCSSYSLAQNGATFKGAVYDKSNGEPVPFCNIYLKGTKLGTSTDLNGFFTISRVPPGQYQVLITSLEFDTIRENISLKADEILNKKFYAFKGGIQLQEVEISTKSVERSENTAVAIQKIDPVVISKLPSVGEPDIAQYLQVLPGVVFTGDQGGQLYIRGGLPVQNKVLLDGMIVYNPFHSIGLFSVFDNDIMKNADVYSAGFGAEYGGRTSSIMDITTRDGNKKRISGKVAASTFGVKANLEGPLIKLKDEEGTTASYIVSFKHSYLPTTSKVLYPYAGEQGLPFYYTDLYAKTSISSAGGSKFSLYGFNFNDKVDYSQTATYKWKNVGLGSSFVLVPQNSNIMVEGVFAYSNYKINFINPSEATDSKYSAINGANMAFNLVRFFGKQELRFGVEGVTTNTDYQVQNPYYAVINMSRSTIDIAGYLKFKYVSRNKKLLLEPSFRAQYYATLAVFSPEPRIAAKYNVNKRFRLKGAAGLYSQTLMSASSDRDVVNLFYGFINAPESQDLSKKYLDHNGNPQTVNSSLQKANHLVGGIEFDFLKYFELDMEVYQKFFNTIINVNRDKVFEDNSTNASRPDELKKTFIIEQGRAQGFDVVLKYDRKRFYFWTVYSLTFNDRWYGNASTNTVQNYPPTFDRRHNVNLVSSYVMGKKKNFELNARWNFGTGFPFTQTQGFYNQLNPQGNINFPYNSVNGTLNYIPAEFNGGRFPVYHRLDISIKHRYRINEHSLLETALGATNLYNRDNIFYIDRFTFKSIYQLPIMPNLNMSLTF
ncbi:MAG TPA: TonB-dependent receptor [Bacteroidia bacterium]|nr:TonB-dependent receptor [Bacteroidia bacterium]